MPEAAVEQVEHGVFGTAHVEVHRHPVLFKFLCHKCIAIAGVDITEVVPTRTRPLRHGVRFADTLAAVLVGHLEPFGGVGERGLSAVTRLVVLQVRQSYGQLVVIDGGDFSVFPMDNGERFPPVTLAAKEPVPELVIYGSLTNLVCFQPFNDFGLARFLIQTVQAEGVILAVDVGAVGCPAGFALQHQFLGFRRAGIVRCHNADNGQVELLGKFEVPGVVSGHSHDSAGAVAC